MSSNRIVSIIDDEIDISDLFHDALSNIGDRITIVTFNDPVIAFEHFTKNKENYVVVISDLRMPNLNGLELLKKVKQISEKVRTILISGYEIENNIVFQHYLQLGIINSFFVKPVTVKKLRQKVTDEILLYPIPAT